jgi:hypothetical protein
MHTELSFSTCQWCILSLYSHPVSIFTDDTVHMGGHFSGHLVPQYSDYNFTGKARLIGTWERSKQYSRHTAIKATNIGHAKGL